MAKEIPVYIKTYGFTCIGSVLAKNEEDFEKKADDLWESQGYDSPTLCHQCATLELSDFEIDTENIKHYFEEE